MTRDKLLEAMIHDDNTIWLLRQLEQLADRLGVEVRYEPLGEHDEELSLKGGYCRLKGRPLVIVDPRLSREGQCRVLAGALRRFDLSKVFLTPAVRALVAD